MLIYTMLAQSGYNEAKQSGDAAMAETYRKFAGGVLQKVSSMPPEKVRFDVEGAPPEK